jgi:uncharacterized protein (DUF305 family)
MTKSFHYWRAARCGAVLALCAGVVRGAAQSATVPAAATATAARAPSDTGHQPYTAADVHFISGMMLHHAQAILIAGWAASHGAGSAVQVLCDRIVVSQRDEIALFKTWLDDRHEAVPDYAHVMMPGMTMDAGMMMPGMLTTEQLTQLDHTRGPEFDRLFLRFMVQHHQGAITMVNDLFASHGGGEEETVYRYAANIFADQTTEIARMQRMLAADLFHGN